MPTRAWCTDLTPPRPTKAMCRTPMRCCTGRWLTTITLIAVLSTVAAGAPQAHRPHVHSLPGAKRPALVGREVFSLLFHTSAGMTVDLRSRPRIASFARSARQALTRRCSVRSSCALLAYAFGTIVASRPINALADAVDSAINQPSTTGHASANGSTRVLHQCLAMGCLRCVGRASPSFHAENKLLRKTSTPGGFVGAASVRMPWAARSLNVC